MWHYFNYLLNKKNIEEKKRQESSIKRKLAIEKNHRYLCDHINSFRHVLYIYARPVDIQTIATIFNFYTKYHNADLSNDEAIIINFPDFHTETIAIISFLIEQIKHLHDRIDSLQTFILKPNDDKDNQNA